MKIEKHKHSLILAVIAIITIGLLVGIFSFTNNINNKVKFAPTPTVVPTPAKYIKISPAKQNTSTWNTFSDDKLKYSIKYPRGIIIDKRQTVEGRITAFIYEEDKTASLPGKVTVLYIADTHKSGIDAFTAFARGDCGSNCNISYKKTDWVVINNAYGIRNPKKNDNSNWYLTNKDQSSPVINAYIGGYLDIKDKKVNEKTEAFEEMIKTFKFDR